MPGILNDLVIAYHRFAASQNEDALWRKAGRRRWNCQVDRLSEKNNILKLLQKRKLVRCVHNRLALPAFMHNVRRTDTCKNHHL